MSEQQSAIDARRQRQIQDVYLRAAELAPAARAAFVQDECKGDSDLLERVESLLAWHDRMSGVLDQGAMHAAAAMGPTAGHSITPPVDPLPSPGNAGVGRLMSSDAIPTGGFTPGTILCDRYRIIGLVGRGGMGEVYRADDLKLGQPVALKFLPREFASDPVRRERFFSEVRITRQLSHPNICRVYDVAEFEGQHFLSMEYIDGEDLASLLKRIGYLSNEKTIDLTRQLLAGLAAAHERGVLHRDLKPANIMIDGRGRVRITDFGIAIAAGEDASGPVVGTPAYMAPEQFSGAAATVRSDLYGLGLVLYEMYSGRKAFSASTLADLREQKEHLTPRAPSEIRKGMDLVVERLIMRCIDRDPRNRPGSIAHLMTSLPGGDPLAAAIAAGETPSPEMVAASGSKEGLRPIIAITLLIGMVLAAFASIQMNPRTKLLMRSPEGKDPRVLADRAREFIERLGYNYTVADSASGLDYDADFVNYAHDANHGPSRWDVFKAYSPVVFWFRQSARPLEHSPTRPEIATGRVGVRPDDPPLQYSGDILIRMDPEGRLRAFSAVPSPTQLGEKDAAPPDWSAFFSAAGLQPSKWTPADPQRLPNHFADSRAAWTGMIPGLELPGRIEAAAYRGKPVSFQILEPWRKPERTVPDAPLQIKLLFVFFITIALAAAYLARKNLRRGRGDRRGATRIALFTLAVGTISWVVNEHHVATLWEFALLLDSVTQALFSSCVIWAIYIALEPDVRRQHSSILVSWTRALAGDWRDPRLGRDVLVGCALGIGYTCFMQFLTVAPGWLGYAEGPLAERDVGFLFATNISAGHLVEQPLYAIADGLGLVLLYAYVKLLFRRAKISAVIWVLIVSAVVLGVPEAPLIFLPLIIASSAAILAVILRFGLVSITVALMTGGLWIAPITLRTSAWYSGIGYVALLATAAIAFYGFRISLGGRRLLSPEANEQNINAY